MCTIFNPLILSLHVDSQAVWADILVDGVLLKCTLAAMILTVFEHISEWKRGKWLEGGREQKKEKTERKDREVEVKAPGSYSNSFV